MDPEHFGPPSRPWAEVSPEEAEARGIYAPVYGLADGPPGTILVAPGDVRGTRLIPERCDGYCMGLDGRGGPNLACVQCGQAVATRIDDCSLWQTVRLDPRAVRRLADDAPAPRVIRWDELREERPGTPPTEPPGMWSPLWAAAAADALARVLAVSAGVHVTVPDGLVAEVFRRPLDALLPPGPPAKTLALAGPGLPATTAEIALVPQHPQTDDTWKPSGTAAPVPLAANVWTYLAFCQPPSPAPRAGGIPADDARLDDLPPLLPNGPFRPSGDVFLNTLARLSDVRQPWLRAIYEAVKTRPYSPPF
ncbi:hypothetical protein [Actinomadura sp. K4S16]|uniref:hypothetical protein n=1 Tax=Actinomadura sp. K4S16 TaxID=1316147 RepID=UPI001F188E94|nr:hypothetical protein [Actinomadura sp. K4S16]